MKKVLTMMMCFLLVGCMCTKTPTPINFEIAPELMEPPRPLNHIEIKKEEIQ